MKELLLVLAALVVLSVVGLFWNRFSMPFQEETRRLTYQESVTGQTSCRANLSRLYREWSVAGSEHKSALEAMARDEALRYRCKHLDPDVAAWVNSL